MEERGIRGKIDYMLSILALDPSGTSTTGYFYFVNWSNYDIGSITGQNYLIQAKNIENLVKNKQVQILVWETSFWWKTNKAQKDLQELVYLNGVLGYLGDKYNCQTQTIVNHTVKDVENKKTITGLVKKDKKWYFKGRMINEHEKDALLVFWIYWVRILRKEWPFA